MATTVVGLFDSETEANAVKTKLVSIGVPASDITLTAQSSTSATSSHTSTADKGFWEELKEMFTGSDDEHYADYYAEGARRGGTLVTASAPDALADRAAEILHSSNAVDIDSRAADWSKTGYTGYKTSSSSTKTQDASLTGANTARTNTATAATAASASAATAATDRNVAVPIVQEQIELGKRQVQRGGVRIIRSVSERPVTESIELREEKVNVERRPVQRDLTGRDLDEAFRDKTVEMTETAEVAVAAKTAKVVEEVLINKDVTQRTEQVRDTVRRTDVQVERIPGKEVSESSSKTVDSSGAGSTSSRTKTSQP